MTCQEFRDVSVTTSPWDVPMEVRAACRIHFESCETCHKWLESIPEPDVYPQRELDEMLVDFVVGMDHANPEYQKLMEKK